MLQVLIHRCGSLIINHKAKMAILTAVLCTLFLPLSIIFYHLYTSGKTRRSTRKELPKPPGSWPIVGHLPILGGADTLLHQVFGAMADTLGPAFEVHLGSHRALVITSSDLVKECFTTHDRVIANRPSSMALKIMGYDDAMFGFTPYGAYWRDMRKLATVELFSHSRLDVLRPVQVAEIDLFLKELYGMWVENGGSGPVRVEMKEKFRDLMMNIGVRTIAGVRYSDSGRSGGERAEEESKRGQKAMEDFLQLVFQFFFSEFVPWLGWLDVINGSTRKLKKTSKELERVLGNWVEQRRQHKMKNEKNVDKVDECTIDVIMSSLQENNYEDLRHHDIDTLIKANCLTLILGANDTTYSTSTWAVSHLLNNRDALKKVQDELEVHVGLHRQVEASDIPNLVYLNAVIKETLRLSPATPLSGPREARDGFTLDGFHISAGTRVFFNVWKMNRDPKIWPDPLQFRPERFLTTHRSLDVRGRDFEYIPFGSGRRMCPGVSLGMQVLHLTLAKLLHGFELGTELDLKVDMTESPGLVMPKATPLEVVLAPRLPSECY